MTIVTSILGGLGFFALIILSVLLHELGHLIPAKIFGVKAPEYFAGFGPKIWSHHVGETEYGFRWIPLGGYVRLLGMYPPRQPDAKPGWLQRIADMARDVEHSGIDPADNGRLFYQAKTWQKLIIMSGGILINLIVAFLLFWGAFGLRGVPVQSTTIGVVHECVIPASRATKVCQPEDAPTPAHMAGMLAGDKVVSFNGKSIATWTDLSAAIRANGEGAAHIVVLRGGKELTLPPVSTAVKVPSVGATPPAAVGFLGVSPRIERKLDTPVDTLARMWDMSKQSLEALVMLPVKVFDVAANIVEQKPRDANSPMSILGASRVAGEVASSELGWQDKVASAATLLGGLNLFLFWLNVIPLPPMDGGHIAGAIFEWIRRGIARLRGKPDPGPFDAAKMLPIAYTVGALLVLLGAVLIVADIISPVRIF